MEDVIIWDTHKTTFVLASAIGKVYLQHMTIDPKPWKVYVSFKYKDDYSLIDAFKTEEQAMLFLKAVAFQIKGGE